MKQIIAALSLVFTFSCNQPTQKEQKAAPTVATRQDTVYESSHAADTPDTAATEQHGTFEFTDYNDDGDYSTLNAKSGNKDYLFINDNTTDRSLNRGDRIAVIWKKGTIYMAGDGDTPADADILISVKKTADGPVSKFRKLYKKEISYTFYEKEYTQSYLDKIYLVAEHYLANTKNPILTAEIKKGGPLSYTIEEQEKNGRSYMMLGIATQNGYNRNTVQWLYLDNESYTLYEYDLPNDKLVEFP